MRLRNFLAVGILLSCYINVEARRIGVRRSDFWRSENHNDHKKFYKSQRINNYDYQVDKSFSRKMKNRRMEMKIFGLSENLLKKNLNNALKYIKIKSQERKTKANDTYNAPDNSLTIDDTARNISTVKALLSLYDNYKLDANIGAVVSENMIQEENTFIDAIYDTDMMQLTRNFLMKMKFISDDREKFKNELKGIGFTRFNASENAPDNPSFKSIFLAEKLGSKIRGLHNCIYYAKKETNISLNYLGYIKHTSFGNKRNLVNVISRLNDTVQNMTMVLIGTSPDLQMSLYTVCFYNSPNYLCLVELDENIFLLYIDFYSYIASADTWIIPPSMISLSSTSSSPLISPPQPTSLTTSSSSSSQVLTQGKSHDQLRNDRSPNLYFSKRYFIGIHLFIVFTITKLLLF